MEAALQARYAFRNPALLATALAVPKANSQTEDNQRLEFLGDAVLQILVSEVLYARYPQADEGHLTAMRAQLVSGRALLARAGRLPGFLPALQEANPAPGWPQKAVADAVEAYFGALWCDGGLAAAKALFGVLYREEDFAAVAQSSLAAHNPKGALQTYAQKRFGREPAYRVVAEEGPAHAPLFRCEAALAGLAAQGEGPSRKMAEAAAAETLLRLLESQSHD